MASPNRLITLDTETTGLTPKTATASLKSAALPLKAA